MTKEEAKPRAIVVESDRIRRQAADAIAWVEMQPDLVSRVAAATWLALQAQALTVKVAELRSAAIRQLASEGWSMSVMSETFGLSKSRIQQIVEGKPPKGAVPARYRERCEWLNSTNGKPCTRAAIYRAGKRLVCSTHAGPAMESGLRLSEYRP